MEPYRTLTSSHELRDSGYGTVVMGQVKPIPDGYPQFSPYLCIDGAAAAIDFYCRVFDGQERMRMPAPDGRIGHAEIQIGNAVVMLADEFPDIGFQSPKTIGGTPVMLSLYVEDVDATFERAVTAGSTSLKPPADQFYGDRSGSFEDPFGHRWSIASHIEDVPPEEMQRRAAAAMGGEADVGA